MQRLGLSLDMISYAKLGTFSTNIVTLLAAGYFVKSKDEFKWFRTFVILKAITIIISLLNYYYF